MNTKDRILSILVLLGSFFQVIGAAAISIEAFTGNTYNGLLVFTQPASFIFSIWGLIYALCIVFAIYQVIPSKNSEYLSYVRPYILAAFVGTVAWLWFAGQGLGLVWVTAPILAAIAYVLWKAITCTSGKAQGSSMWERLASTYSLYPFAAWTLIATGVNIHSMSLQYGLVGGLFMNVFIALTILIAVFVLTIVTLRSVNFSPWYGLVFVWASFGIVIANITNPEGAWLVAVAAGLLGIYVFGLILSRLTLK